MLPLRQSQTLKSRSIAVELKPKTFAAPAVVPPIVLLPATSTTPNSFPSSAPIALVPKKFPMTRSVVLSDQKAGVVEAEDIGRRGRIPTNLCCLLRPCQTAT